LVIRDGWWYRKSCENNAICQWDTFFTDKLMKNYPNTLLDASGEAVGLPKWFMWNSEVWHMTIWSGRVSFQSLVRINKSIEEWEFFKNKNLLEIVNNCKKSKSFLHLMWLLQVQWVHSHIDHLFAILDFCKRCNFENVLIHIITDWRDSPVNESLLHIKSLEDKIKKIWLGKIVTIGGRFFAMDRDKRRDRTLSYYKCIVDWLVDLSLDNAVFENVLETVNGCHQNQETDEFIRPRKLKWYEWFNENDWVLFFNFRTDRTRQITQAIVEDEFVGFERTKKNINFLAMTQYYKPMNWKVMFDEPNLDNLLWEVISNNWYRQLRISETEKYAHVTFFFNWQKEEPFENEDRILIDSPKVKTYDLKPEMSVFELKDKLVENIKKNKYNLIVTNFVNWDMVWHTWISEAIKKAVHSVDVCLEETVNVALEFGYDVLVFADHGNAEDQTIEWRTSHTTNPVPFIYISKNKNVVLKSWKGLKDIAPTVLEIMSIKKPKEMTWESIISLNI